MSGWASGAGEQVSELVMQLDWATTLGRPH
jgi:hypothetical protein